MAPVKPKKAAPRAVANTVSIPSPTAGLNSKDPLAKMDEQFAVTLENWFPTPTSVDIRNGMSAHVTGLGAITETLAEYNNTTTKKIFAGAGTAYYDVTSAGAVGGSVISGLTNVRHQHINMSNSGGHFLMMVNGADKLRGYDGTNWWVDGDGAHDISGLNTNTAIHINTFKRRVWLVEKNSMSAWYLPTDAISGAAVEYDLGPIFKLGGSLNCMVNWTLNASTGIDDYAAFISTNGEVALYQGTDPASATTWALVGTFRIGVPIGRRCCVKVGADVVILTTDGAIPLSKALLTDKSQKQVAVTDKIDSLFSGDADLYKDNYGWQPILYPDGDKLIINVPKVAGVESYQYVMNTVHGAWCKFTGWNAYCFAVLDDTLYYGSDTKIYKADTGSSDDGSNITAVAQQAYSYFGKTGQLKRFTMCRPVFITNGELTPAIVVNVDFQQNRTTSPPAYSVGDTELWDDGYWDDFDWAADNQVYKKWIGVSALGYSAGIRLVTQSNDLTARWSSTDFIYERGGTF
mgnify:CR=1 FL=1